jgi:uncharacterized protein YecE (DUF72 family)
VLSGTEINSSFHRAHASQTYAKWAASTPRGFRFAVKMPAAITHECRLRRVRAPLEQFLSEVSGLGNKLGPLLMQLPPSLEFEPRVARRFFALLRKLHGGLIVCEPRHASWFTARVNALLIEHRVGRVAADPAAQALAGEPGGWPGAVYFRLHGSPRRYWSVYVPDQIGYWSGRVRAFVRTANVWCIFDNTAGSGAIDNALQMRAAINDHRDHRRLGRR